MRLIAKIAFGALASLLLISGMAVLSPHAVHAVVATIIRDQDNPARHPFATSCSSGLSQTTGNLCATPVIPAGEEVVIETISLIGSSDPNNTTLGAYVTTTASGVNQDYYLDPLSDSGNSQPTGAAYFRLQSLRLYADPGKVIACAGMTRGANPNRGVSVACNISGYYVTLP